MKALRTLLLLGFATTTSAQGSPPATAAAPGCGADNTKFEVTTAKSQHPISKPNPGKALIYFLQDDSYFENMPRPATRFGLDGEWIGATHANSYFYISLDPGDHHLCANWQNFLGVRTTFKSAATHFTAEPDRVYYYVVSDFYIENHGPATIKINPLDSDQAQLLMSKFAFSTSKAKK